jgi:DNA-binding response OmpR family regulator
MKTPAKQILVVEDDRFLRRAWAASLRQRGWMVLTAGDGEEAFAMPQTETVDLIRLDRLMPKLHGLEIMRTLKAEEKTQGILVLILSSSSREQDVQEIMQLGAVDYFGKAHLSLQELGNRVAQLMGA